MRILPIPEISVPASDQVPLPSAATPAPQAPSSVDRKRLQSLEQIAEHISEKLESMEARMSILEKSQPLLSQANPPVPPAPAQSAPERPAPLATAPAEATPIAKTTLSLNTEAVKKNLLAKMWKYMNDEQPSRAA